MAEPEAETRAPDVHVAGGDHAVEGCRNALVGLQSNRAAKVGFEGFDIAFGGGYIGDLPLVVGLALVAILFREDALGDEDAIALNGNGGESQLRLLLSDLRLRLRDLLASLIDLLVEIRGVDDGEELALADVVADVDEPSGDVAVGAGVDVGLG